MMRSPQTGASDCRDSRREAIIVKPIGKSVGLKGTAIDGI